MVAASTTTTTFRSFRCWAAAVVVVVVVCRMQQLKLQKTCDPRTLAYQAIRPSSALYEFNFNTRSQSCMEFWWRVSEWQVQEGWTGPDPELSTQSISLLNQLYQVHSFKGQDVILVISELPIILDLEVESFLVLFQKSTLLFFLKIEYSSFPFIRIILQVVVLLFVQKRFSYIASFFSISKPKKLFPICHNAKI